MRWVWALNFEPSVMTRKASLYGMSQVNIQAMEYLLLIEIQSTINRKMHRCCKLVYWADQTEKMNYLTRCDARISTSTKKRENSQSREKERVFYICHDKNLSWVLNNRPIMVLKTSYRQTGRQKLSLPSDGPDPFSQGNITISRAPRKTSVESWAFNFDWNNLRWCAEECFLYKLHRNWAESNDLN
jgi:hypothetical protein